MKKLIFSFFAMYLFATSISAQNYLFKMHRYYCSELYDITVTLPKGFTVVNGLTPFRVHPKKDIGMFYQPVLVSKNKECLLLFPCFDNFPSHLIAARTMAYGEVKAALNLDAGEGYRKKIVDGKIMIQGEGETRNESEAADRDLSQYVKILTGDDIPRHLNADTMYLFKVQLPEPYKGIYSECIGINAIKHGSPSAMMKILLTKEGKKSEDEYIRILLNSIQYSNDAPLYSKERKDKVIKKMKRKFWLHKSKSKFPVLSTKKGTNN